MLQNGNSSIAGKCGHKGELEGVRCTFFWTQSNLYVVLSNGEGGVSKCDWVDMLEYVASISNPASEFGHA